MNRLVAFVCAVLAIGLMSGCAGVSGGAFGGGSPIGGWAYTRATVPSARLHAPLDEDAQSVRVGHASVVNVLGVVGVGDASIGTAMRNGGIEKIHHVDHQVTSLLGIYSKWTVLVHGE